MIAGVDFSTFAIDVVLLDEDTNDATHLRRRLDIGHGRALTRARRVRDVMPARGAWLDSGVTVVAIEKPMGQVKGAAPLLLVQGAILATLPARLRVVEVTSDEWRRAVGLKVRAPREVHKAASVDFAVRHWANRPAKVDDNAADAFCIAWAARELDRRAVAA